MCSAKRNDFKSFACGEYRNSDLAPKVRALDGLHGKDMGPHSSLLTPNSYLYISQRRSKPCRTCLSGP